MVLFLAFGIIKLTSLKTFSLVNVQHSETYHKASMSFTVYRAWNKKNDIVIKIVQTLAYGSLFGKGNILLQQTYYIYIYATWYYKTMWMDFKTATVLQSKINSLEKTTLTQTMQWTQFW